MVYLISQIPFMFLTQIYYNMNFITSSSVSSQDFSVTLRSIFVDCFWRTFFVAHKKCIFLNMSEKLVLKNWELCLNTGKPLKNFLQSATLNSSKNTGLPQFFFTGFSQLYFKNINLLAKTKRCLLC